MSDQRGFTLTDSTDRVSAALVPQPRSAWDLDAPSFSIRPPPRRAPAVQFDRDALDSGSEDELAELAAARSIRPRRDPVGVVRDALTDGLMRSLRARRRSSRTGAAPKTPFPVTRLAAFSDNEEEEADGALLAVDGYGAPTGEAFRLERRCDLPSGRCATVLAPAPRRSIVSSAARCLGLHWLLSAPLLVPWVVLGSARLSLRGVVLGARFAGIMLLLYAAANAILAGLRVVYVLGLGDVDGRYQYLVSVVAVVSSTLAWLPMYLGAGAVWAVGTALGHEMGAPPSLFVLED